MQTLPNPVSASPATPEYVDTTIRRRPTRAVQVGDITIGGGAPVVVQSMINEDTLDIEGSVAARNHIGGTAPGQVRAAVAAARARRDG